MHSSTAPIQPPAHPRTTRSAPAAPSPAAPSQGVPNRFGDALNQAMASPEPDASVMPASPAPTGTVKGAPATTPPAAPAAPADPAADPSKPGKDAPAAPVAEAPAAEVPAAETKNKPSAEAAKPSEGPQALALFQPILPMPLQAVPTAMQPAAPPSKAGDAVPATGQDGSTTPVAGMNGRQPPAAPVPAAQAAATSASMPSPRAAAQPGASGTDGPAAQKHSAAAAMEEEPSAPLFATPTDAAPLPAAPAIPPSASPMPAPLSVALHPAPAPSQASAPSAATPPPPPAAAQVGPVLASFAAGAVQPGAPQHLTIRLDPLDLGRVQVRIERAPDGSARVDLKVEKPDTLLLLLRDQPQLHRALDLAGVPATERTLQFHLAPPDAPTPNASAFGGMTGQSNAEGGHGQHPGQPHSGRPTTRGAAISSNEPLSGPAAFRRAGVDITA